MALGLRYVIGIYEVVTKGVAENSIILEGETVSL
jgi:hypothetical protein